MKNFRVFIAGLAMLAALVATGCGEKKGEGADAGDKKAAVEKLATMELYVMSKCPYGVQALDAAIPAIEQLEGAVELKIDYIGTISAEGKLESMHGEPELEGNIIQQCTKELAADKHFAMIKCMDENWREIPGNWKACAEKAGVDVKALEECKDGDKGQQLAKASFERSQQAGAMGSPTIKVGGENHKGGRKTADFLRSLCGVIPAGKHPTACKEIPEPAVVEIVGLTDARCGQDCNLDNVLMSLKDVFPGLTAKVLDYGNDPEAKRIIEESAIKFLPAVLFNETIEKDPDGAQQMARWLVPAGTYKSLRIKAEFDPTAEICGNGQDDTGNGLVDCADPTCVSSLVCRAEKKGSLEVFVMSQCPYGTMALDGAKELLDAFGKDMAFDVHYIANMEGEEFRSLHGQPEVDENIRELCAMKHYPAKNKYMEYVWCRNKDIRNSDWKPCATGGIAAAVIEKCSTGAEGKALLAEDIKLAETLRIGASPTWLVNNKYLEQGVAPADIQAKFCARNPGLAGCSKVLSGPPAPQAGPQGGAPAGGSCGG
jgi:glutaredoxin